MQIARLKQPLVFLDFEQKSAFEPGLTVGNRVFRSLSIERCTSHFDLEAYIKRDDSAFLSHVELNTSGKAAHCAPTFDCTDVLQIAAKNEALASFACS